MLLIKKTTFLAITPSSPLPMPHNDYRRRNLIKARLVYQALPPEKRKHRKVFKETESKPEPLPRSRQDGAGAPPAADR